MVNNLRSFERSELERNRHFLENEYGDLSFFCCFELSNEFLSVT